MSDLKTWAEFIKEVTPCVALFFLLVVQQFLMHRGNVRRLEEIKNGKDKEEH